MSGLGIRNAVGSEVGEIDSERSLSVWTCCSYLRENEVYYRLSNMGKDQVTAGYIKFVKSQMCGGFCLFQKGANYN